MTQVGAIIQIHRRGDMRWVVTRQEFDAQGRANRWHVVSLDIDAASGTHNGLTVGEGDLVTLVAAPVYEAGAEVRYEGQDLTVIEDLGDFVKFSVPASRFPLKGGHALTIPSGNTAVIAKSDVVLQQEDLT
jgi:hypothetical protein